MFPQLLSITASFKAQVEHFNGSPVPVLLGSLVIIDCITGFISFITEQQVRVRVSPTCKLFSTLMFCSLPLLIGCSPVSCRVDAPDCASNKAPSHMICKGIVILFPECRFPERKFPEKWCSSWRCQNRLQWQGGELENIYCQECRAWEISSALYA